MLYNRRNSSLSTISGPFDDGYSSGSPLSSPLTSPYMSPGGSPRESLNTQFANSMSLQPPNKSNNTNTFVHKLYNMVIDNQYQHLIAWNYTGASFIVCNISEFSKEVLPKHFKHNNFSSFVRQLNMYGFHKVNKSPRGHRTSAENQIWEFSHPKFIKDRPDYLDDIRRKSIETENSKKDHGDINSHMNMMQVSQSEMIQHLVRLQENFQQVLKELAETKAKQTMQQQTLKSMMDFLNQKHGVQLPIPTESNINIQNGLINETPPSIFITTHDIPLPPDTQISSQTYLKNKNDHHFQQQNHSGFKTSNSFAYRNTAALTVQTQNLHPSQINISPSLSPMDQQNSPALSAYHTALNTPVSPSPSSFIPDDDIPSIYSPHSPVNNTFIMNSMNQQQDNLMMMDHHLQGEFTYNQNSINLGVTQRIG